MTDKALPKINVHGHLRHDDDVAARLRIWDEWNVVKFCALAVDPLMPWGGDGHYYSNGDVAAAMKAHPDRIVGFATVSALRGHLSAPEVVEQFKGQGFTGLKFCGNSYPYADERYFPYYAKAEALGMPIVFHTGLVAPTSDPSVDRRHGIAADNMRPMHLDPVLRSFPKLVVVGAHLGVHHANEALGLIESYANAYYDFSGGGGHKTHVRRVLAAMLPHPGLETDMRDPDENRALFWFTKLVFGTDNPEPSVWVPNAELIMDRLEIPLDLRRKFYYATAARILGIDEAA